MLHLTQLVLHEDSDQIYLARSPMLPATGEKWC